MGKSKTPAPYQPEPAKATPLPTPDAGPIQRTATSAEAQDRAASNKSADLLAGQTTEDPATTKAGMLS